MEWYNLLAFDTKAYIREAGFESIIDLLLERFVSTTLVQWLIKRWCPAHTIHIAEQEMTVTPYNFYHMTGLSFKGAIINLDGMLGIQLGLDMLGRK